MLILIIGKPKMSYMHEEHVPPISDVSLWYGTFAHDVSDLGDKANVMLPELSLDTEFGPCFWQSRDSTTLPNQGDRCCVMFDNRGQPWIFAWWPFAT